MLSMRANKKDRLVYILWTDLWYGRLILNNITCKFPTFTVSNMFNKSI